MEDNMREVRLRWFKHVKGGARCVLARKCEMLAVICLRKDKGRPRKN